jgi:hypothetical protein
MNPDQKEVLAEINSLLTDIKEKINANWSKGEDLELHVEDNDNSPVKHKKEDIEPIVKSMWIEPKL